MGKGLSWVIAKTHSSNTDWVPTMCQRVEGRIRQSLFLSNILTSGRVRRSIINLQRVISPVTKIKPGEGLGSVGGYRDMFRFCGLRSLWVGVMWAETCLNPGASHMGIWGKRSVPSRVNSKYEGPEVKMSQAQCLEQDELGRECLWWDQGEW